MYDNNTYKLTKCLTTTAYLVHNHYFQTLRDQFSNCLTNNNPIDKEWNLLIKIHNWFIIQPNLCVQRSGYSDIEKKYTDYKQYFDDAEIPVRMSKINIKMPIEVTNTPEFEEEVVQQVPVKVSKFNFNKSIEVVQQLPIRMGKFNLNKRVEIGVNINPTIIPTSKHTYMKPRKL